MATNVLTRKDKLATIVVGDGPRPKASRSRRTSRSFTLPVLTKLHAIFGVLFLLVALTSGSAHSQASVVYCNSPGELDYQVRSSGWPGFISGSTDYGSCDTACFGTNYPCLSFFCPAYNHCAVIWNDPARGHNNNNNRQQAGQAGPGQPCGGAMGCVPGYTCTLGFCQ